MPLKLNLACGTDVREGWINLDVVWKWPLARRHCDVVWDARTDAIPCANCVVDEIYAGYLFLHLAPQHHERVLADIRRVLKPGGLFVVGEVDMAVLLPRWLENPDNPYLSGLVWGEQGELPGTANEEQRKLADFDKHCQGFTEASLRRFLARGGFPEARRIFVHKQPDVWYELTLEAIKPTGP